MENNSSSNKFGDVVNFNENIHEHHQFTIGWLLDSLRENDAVYQELHGSRAVKGVSAYDISGGKGFFSAIFRCIITFTDSDDQYSTILKIPGFASFQEAQSKSDIPQELLDSGVKEKCVNMHQFECDFYDHIAPLLDVPVPKVYKTVQWILEKQEGCLHMEDLTVRGRTISFFDNINIPQIKCLVKHLARMHKNILTSDSRIWKGKFDSGQNCYVDFFEMYESGYDTFLKKNKNYDNLHDLAKKYRKFSMSKDFYHYANKQAFIDLGMPAILVHGDLHMGNVMIVTDNNDNITNEIAAIVDWQTLHEGSPMSDLARYLVFCADGVVRRQAEAMIFDFYYECLLKEFGGDPKKVPYSVGQLRKAYNFAFLTQAFFILADLDFFFGSMIGREEISESIKNACYDYGVLKALHAYQDADCLLQGEMKDIFEKFGI